MADDPVERIHLSLMQDVLPVGLAMLQRARTKGLQNLATSLVVSDSPVADLRDEGQRPARELRDKLDRVRPGLGNPLQSVDIKVQEASENNDLIDHQELLEVLDRIENRLLILGNHINKGDSNSDLDI